MALEAGDAEKGTGLAGAMADELKKVINGFQTKDAAPGLNAQAKAIVDYFKANAEVTGKAADVTVGVDTAPVTGTIT